MNKTVIWFLLIITTAFMGGCEKSGYSIIINTNHIKYDDLQQIGKILKGKGFETMVQERKIDIPKYPDEVYILFEKKLDDKPFNFVGIYINYVKDISNNVALNLRIDVHNAYKGMTNMELKGEIDKIGDLVYQELVGKVGKEKVMIECKEIGHRVIFF